MPTVTTCDGVEIFYKAWGNGRPVVFIHGWPLNADAREDQMKLVADHGFRSIAGVSGEKDRFSKDLLDFLQR